MHELQEYLLRIDGPLLREQRLALLKLGRMKVSHKMYRALEGLTALLDEIADQAHDRYGIDCLLEGSEDDDPSLCECQRPGYFTSGVPGILAHLENGRLPEGAKVERCDFCQRYATDQAALDKLKELGHVQS